MLKGNLFIKFLSDFCVGSGIGDSYHADSIIARDEDDIPYLPGRALKGALREGASFISGSQDHFKNVEKMIFGSRSYTRETNENGSINISSGRLQTDLRNLLLTYSNDERREYVSNLVQIRSQITLDDKRQTKKGSLRGIECGVAGLEFNATLECEVPKDLDGEFVKQYLFCVCAATKSIGAMRSRGLGEIEVKLRFDDGSESSDYVTLPECKGAV